MLLISLITFIIIFICVVIHYEALYHFDKVSRILKIRGRFKVVAGSMWAFMAHVIEVWIFGIGYYLIQDHTQNNYLMALNGEKAIGFFDSIYFSFISYTSLGYGDLMPKGDIRFLAGTEALIGLVMIAWTASFLYIKMEHYWEKGNNNN